MNNTVKSAIPVAVISALLVALFFVGYSFWFKDRVLTEFAAKQQSDMESLKSAYQTEMQKVADNIMSRVDQTNKTLDAAVAQRTSDLFLSQDESRKVETAKINALADAIMGRLNSVIPTPEDQDRGYSAVSERVADRLNPILSEIARTGNLTRSDVEFYSSQISGMIDGLLRDEIAEKQRLNNNLMATRTIAQDSLRLSQEMSALYLSSLKDEGVLSRILSLPVRVVQDVSTLSIVGSSERKKVEERLFTELNGLEKRLADVQAQMPQNGSADATATAAPASAATTAATASASATPSTPTNRARPTAPTTASAGN
jgi:hypothetical protein